MAGYRNNNSYKPPRAHYLRSFIPFILAFAFLAFLLTSLGLLSHYRSPAAKQQLGWQSWDIVKVAKAGSAGGSSAGTNETVGDGEDGNDGWPWSDLGYTLPLDNWDPLAPHTTGCMRLHSTPVHPENEANSAVTEIAIVPCYLPPWLSDYCAPKSTPEDDKAKGRWVLVEQDLNIKTGLWYLNVYYRRTRRLDVPLITHLRIAPYPIPDTLKSDLDGWTLAEGDLHSGVWPTQSELRLYYKTREQRGSRGKRQAVISEEIVTELDVVFGDDEPFYGFERVQGEKIVEAKEGKWESVGLAFRRGNYVAPGASDLRFRKDGTFKVLQIADLHYSVGKGECKDTHLTACEGDAETAKWLGDALDAEKPDMVVFSGDQLNGQKTSYDSRSVLAKFARPVINRRIPWAAIFGNHDSEIADDRAYQMRTLMNMPYSLARAGPKEVDGVGNYLVKIHSSDPQVQTSLIGTKPPADYLLRSHIHLFSLYFLDSGSYRQRTTPWAKWEYDYIKPSQIEWFRNASSHIKPISRPFKPDGASDLDKIWRRRSGPKRRMPVHERDGPTTLAKPNAMMFFHIPLPEAYDTPDANTQTNEPLILGNDITLNPGSSKTNSHFLDDGLLPQVAIEGDDGGMTEVKVLSHGHCHNQDRCQRVRGVWMCFDGGSSYSGYGHLGFDRRVRMYQLSEHGERVESYKRTASGELIDRQVLVQPLSG